MTKAKAPPKVSTEPPSFLQLLQQIRTESSEESSSSKASGSGEDSLVAYARSMAPAQADVHRSGRFESISYSCHQNLDLGTLDWAALLFFVASLAQNGRQFGHTLWTSLGALSMGPRALFE